MLARKSIKQCFNPNERIRYLMEAFRQMTNDCIRCGLAEKKTSLKSLSVTCYPKLKNYEAPSAYKLCAISRAAGILHRYRKLAKEHGVREPYCTKPSLTTCYGLKRTTDKLRLPGEVEVSLNAHTQLSLSQPDIEVRSVTLTLGSLSISIRKQVEPLECMGMLAIDSNLENATVADTQSQIERYDLSRVATVKSQCRRTKQRLRRNDLKVREHIFRKYGRLESDRVGWLLHNVSANIVLQARLKRQAIAMEDLKGIRKLYRKGNLQGRCFRARMNGWSFAELQRQIQYKSDWNGIPVIYVKPHGTSAKCSMCGHRMLPEENRKLYCPKCGLTVDRDMNAAKNILARALRFGAVGSVGEAMAQEPSRPEVILEVDTDQLTRRPPTS